LIQLITFKILGYKKCKLPLNTSEYWNEIKTIENQKIHSDFLVATFPGRDDYRLYKYDINNIGIPIIMYYSGKGIHNHIKVRQYEYIDENIKIKINADDIVLDCGACWGDTALFFAKELNENGHIFSFEFIPNNIEIFNKNIGLNTKLKDKITLIPKPLGEFNNKKIYYIDTGPGSRVVTEPIENSDIFYTINIDTFFMEYGLEKVDFIKLDIEGSELPALKGAINTIQRFKPKLAISIYHSMNDFINISEYLHSLDCGYKFYLKHGTIHNEETVLLASI
jgi:FkbM family methyltransferase